MRGFVEQPDGGSIAVTAYVRPSMLLEPMDTKLETLRTLASEDVIDTLDVEQWPGKIPVSANSYYYETLDTFDRFEHWADKNDVSIRPPFSVRTATSEIREETYQVLRTPGMCLEVAIDGELAGVFPHTDAGSEYGVTEAIATLRANSLQTDARPADVTQTSYDTCPQCSGELVRVQGVEVCHDCVWNNWDEVVGATDESAAVTLNPH